MCSSQLPHRFGMKRNIISNIKIKLIIETSLKVCAEQTFGCKKNSKEHQRIRTGIVQDSRFAL
jgi:hypothetical protein